MLGTTRKLFVPSSEHQANIFQIRSNKVVLVPGAHLGVLSTNNASESFSHAFYGNVTGDGEKLH